MNDESRIVNGVQPAWRLGVTLLGVLAALSVMVLAQEPAFTVASIKVTSTGAQKKAESAAPAISAGGVIEPPRGGRVSAQAATARTLVRYAFGETGSNGAIVRPLETARVLGGPEWIDSTMFDIDARRMIPAEDHWSGQR